MPFNIFDWYNQLTASLSPAMQLGISFILLLLIFWYAFCFIKSGQWIFGVIVIVLFPAAIPIVKKAIEIILLATKFLILQVMANF